jgi:hypothetical protein
MNAENGQTGDAEGAIYKAALNLGGVRYVYVDGEVSRILRSR